MLVDSHCHLDRLSLREFGGDIALALDAAREAGVGHMLCVGIDLESFPAMMQLVRRFPFISASVGVHPNEQEGEEPSVERLVAEAQDPAIVAIGETGLDYFRSGGDVEWQRQRFRVHIRAAREVGLPLIIHTRDAMVDTLRIMDEEGASAVGGVMHCFTGTASEARQALDLGFHISFSGIVTFPSATEIQQAAISVPADKLLVETDSPYLAPVPHRGRSNHPAWVVHVAEALARLRGVPFPELAEQTTANFARLFGGTCRPLGNVIDLHGKSSGGAVSL